MKLKCGLMFFIILSSQYIYSQESKLGRLNKQFKKIESLDSLYKIKFIQGNIDSINIEMLKSASTCININLIEGVKHSYTYIFSADKEIDEKLSFSIMEFDNRRNSSKCAISFYNYKNYHREGLICFSKLFSMSSFFSHKKYLIIITPLNTESKKIMEYYGKLILTNIL